MRPIFRSRVKGCWLHFFISRRICAAGSRGRITNTNGEARVSNLTSPVSLQNRCLTTRTLRSRRLWLVVTDSLLDKRRASRSEPENNHVVNRLEITIFHNYDCNNEPPIDGWERGQITDLKKWQAYYRSPSPVYLDKFSATNEFKTTPQSQSPAADVLLALSKYDAVVEELRHASQLPYSRFPLNYNDDSPYGILLPHLAAMKRCAQVLQLRAIAELSEGQGEKALADVKLILRLTDSIRSEPMLISQLVASFSSCCASRSNPFGKV